MLCESREEAKAGGDVQLEVASLATRLVGRTSGGSTAREAPAQAPPGPQPSPSLPRAGPLTDPLLPDAAGEGVAQHELPVRDGCRRRRDLLGALRGDLLVGNGLGELSDPEPTGVAGSAVGRQDVVGSYGLVGVGHRRVFP